MSDDQQTVETTDDFDAAFDAYAEGREPEDVASEEQESNAAEETKSEADEAEADVSAEQEEDAQETEGENTQETGEESASEADELQGGEKASDKKQDDTKDDYWKHRYESDIGRVNAYQRKADDAARQVEELRNELDKVKAQPPEKAAESDEKEVSGVDIEGINLDEVKEFSPEIHAVLVQQQQNAQQAQERLNTLTNQLKETQQALQERVVDDHLAAITAAHPNVSELVNAPEFIDWLEKQPPAMKQIHQDGSTQDVIWMFDQYKAFSSNDSDKAKAEAAQLKRNERLKKSATIPNRQPATQKDDGAGDFESAFNHFASKKKQGD